MKAKEKWGTMVCHLGPTETMVTSNGDPVGSFGALRWLIWGPQIGHKNNRDPVGLFGAQCCFVWGTHTVS